MGGRYFINENTKANDQVLIIGSTESNNVAISVGNEVGKNNEFVYIVLSLFDRS